MCPSLFSSWPSLCPLHTLTLATKHPPALVRPNTFDKTTPEMSSTPPTGVPTMTKDGPPKLEKKPVKFSNLLREYGQSQRRDWS